MSGLSALCLQCGLCCDGSLFSHVRVEPSEADPLRSAGVALEPGGGGALALRQPCAALAGASCTLYSVRPGGCRRLVCLLASAFEAGELSLPEATELVAAARRLLAARDAGLEPFLTKHFLGRARRPG